MAAVYHEIVLAGDGEEYTVRPSFLMVQLIEANGISIVGVCHRFERGDIHWTATPDLLPSCLNRANRMEEPDSLVPALFPERCCPVGLPVHGIVLRCHDKHILL